MGQYFDNDPNLKSEKFNIKYYVNNQELLFKSDRGVFSKRTVDFGTKTMLEYLLKQPLSGRGVDLGCGLGIIGITLSLFKDVAIDMVDINKRAVLLAKENAKQYNIDKSLILESDGLKALTQKNYDFILTNPPIRAGKATVYSFFTEAYEYLKTGGFLLVVIQKKQGAPSAKNKILELFGNCQIVERKKGYHLLKAFKEV